MEQRTEIWGCLRRRQCLVPTLRGLLLLALGCAALTYLGIRGIAPFLMINDPAPGGVLVVEGWVPDYALEATAAEFKQHHYDKLFVTGIPLDQGAPLSEYRNYAELGAAILLKFGLSTNVVQPVPTPDTRRDRTYAMARSVDRWMREHGMTPAKVNLMTLGPHARRSRLLFQWAMGKGVTVGVTAIPSRNFDPAHWWRSSYGARAMISETVAYAYARCLFHPGDQ
jgi:hypothetical protein